MQILEAIPWYGWIAIVAIIAGATQAIVKSNHRHAERMALIQRGGTPDEDER